MGKNAAPSAVTSEKAFAMYRAKWRSPVHKKGLGEKANAARKLSIRGGIVSKQGQGKIAEYRMPS